MNTHLKRISQILTFTCLFIATGVQVPAQAEMTIGFSPFTGYRLLYSGYNSNDNVELGFRFIHYMDPRDQLALEVELGLIPTRLTNLQPTEIHRAIRHANVQARYDIMEPSPETRLFVTGALNAAGERNLDTLQLEVGVGARMLFQDNLWGRIDLKKSADTTIQVGFETKLDLFGKKRSLSGPASTPVDVSIDVSDHLTIYQVDPRSFIDVPTPHWANKSVNFNTTYGIINVARQQQMYYPKGAVSREEALEWIAKASFFKNELTGRPVSINYTLKAKIAVPFYVSTYIADPASRQIIKTLNDKKTCLPGTYESVWNGRDSENRMLPNGQYLIVVRVTDLTGKETYAEKLVQITQRFFYEAPLSVWTDGQNAERLFAYLREARISPQDMKRIEFITLLAKALQYFGIPQKAIVDVSPYRDERVVKNVVPELRPYVWKMINVLGYGGDHLNRLQPEKRVTRAEASQWLLRLIRFKNNFDKVLDDIRPIPDEEEIFRPIEVMEPVSKQMLEMDREAVAPESSTPATPQRQPSPQEVEMPRTQPQSRYTAPKNPVHTSPKSAQYKVNMETRID